VHADIRDMTVQELLQMHDLDADDLAAVRKLGAHVLPRLDEYGDIFYEWIADLPEYQIVFTSPEITAHARAEQLNYWRRTFTAEVDEHYVTERRQVGATHARIGLSLPSYFAAMNYSFVLLTKTLYDHQLSHEDYLAALQSFTKLMHFDTTIVAETYSRLINERIARQSQALMEMSTPVAQIWEDILMLPVVGIIDSRRAQDLMLTVLKRISQTRAKVFIMDISGVAVVDSGVANHLIKITKSTGLMGCTSLVSGISPEIAQTMVNLGFDTSQISTSATLHDALERAFRLVGRTVSELPRP
jgi:rsbT co-antagonist protein RsbR